MASASSQLARISPLSEHTELLSSMREALRYTPVKRFQEDGSFSVEHIPDSYYLSNYSWDWKHFASMEQFRHFSGAKWSESQTYRIHFPFTQESLNIEAKFVFHQMLFSDAWLPSATFTVTRSALSRLAKYVNQYAPGVESFSEMQDEAFVQNYIDYLTFLHLQTHYTTADKKKPVKSSNLAIPSVIYNHLQRLLRDEYFDSLTTDLWREDVWDIRYFRKFGMELPKSSSTKSIVFTDIENRCFRSLAKKYLRQKLITGSIVWSTAHGKCVLLRQFFHFLGQRHPDWVNLRKLSRKDAMDYLEELTLYANTELKNLRQDANPRRYPKAQLSNLRSILLDMQIFEYPEAPEIPVQRLIRLDDTRGYTSIDPRQVKYVPDFVLKQFFERISLFPEKYLPVVLTMYYTGLRVSDALELKWDCLVKLNGQYWVETYVWKTKTFDHRCPVTDEFAGLLRQYIDASKANSNEDNNPEHFIFVNYTGVRKGEPYSPHALSAALREYTEKADIVDENGQRFHFKNHAFRHTFSVKMINNGADILTVMQLLAHASPKMTMVYAKLLDSSKRDAFEKVAKSGAFTFSSSNGEVVYNGDVPADILDNLWQLHKLNAVDTPYGTCMQRKNGRCGFARQPPCLTCNGGKPCRDLCVGAFEGDSEKYGILIDSAQRMVNVARKHGREDMAEENESLLRLLQSVKDVIDKGGLIYGHMQRLAGDGNHG